MSILYVVGYPELQDSDFEWIQAYRRLHDPQVDLVAPHFTLVFGLSNLQSRVLEAHVETVARAGSPIEFVLRHAMKERVDDSTYLYLIPQEGGGDLVKLHGALYAGPLLAATTLGVPFVPHVTVGRFGDEGAAKAVFDDIRKTELEIRGRLSAIAVARLDNGELEQMAVAKLGGT